MGLFDKFKKGKQTDKETSSLQMYLYSEEELEVLDKFIVDMFGDYANVMHEVASLDIHLDVCIVEPSPEEPYYKLVTMGAGAYRMQVPKEYERFKLDYAEYVIYLPKDWNIQSNKEDDCWPIHLLKNTARIPIWNDTWLSYGHTTQGDAEGSPYASSTRFNSIVLNCAENAKGDVRLVMPSGKVVNFYEIVPLYPEELEFKLKHDANKLFEMFVENHIPYKVLDLNRKNALDNEENELQ